MNENDSLYEAILNNWKTTVAGLVAALAAFVIAYPQHFEAVPLLRDIAGFIQAGGLLFLGISGKDASKKL